MQQRPTRYYITQNEDQTVVRSVPMARRTHTVLPADERAALRDDAQQAAAERRSVADRFRSVVRKAPGMARR